MKKYLKEHIDYIEHILRKEKNNFSWKTLSNFNEMQIGFFQHERLIHLLVTFFFGLLFFGSIVTELFLINLGNNLIFLSLSFLVVGVILLILLVFYIWHYFVLENGVQKLYKLQKEIMKRC